MSARNALIKRIALLEKKLQRDECEVLKHKAYFGNLLSEKGLILLLPMSFAFVWGWQAGKRLRLFTMIRNALSLGLSYALSMLKQRLFLML